MCVFLKSPTTYLLKSLCFKNEVEITGIRDCVWFVVSVSTEASSVCSGPLLSLSSFPEFTGVPPGPCSEFTVVPPGPCSEFTGVPPGTYPEFTGVPSGPCPEFTRDPL